MELWFKKEENVMATKSFTSDYVFNRKTADSLLSALQNDRDPNKTKNIKVTKIKDTKSIASMKFRTRSGAR